MAPNWITTRNIPQNDFDTFIGMISSNKIICPVELIGSHSVIPSTIPYNIDFKISIILSSILQKKPGNPGYIFTFQRFVCRCIRHKSTSCEQVYIHHNLDNESTLVSPICNVFYVLLYVSLNFFSVELPCLHLLVIIQFEII